MEETRQQIMDAVIDQFNEKGMKFTMDDISRELHISKKTIYKEFDDKDELFFATVDYGFSAIKKKEAEIIADESLNLVDKISRLIVCLPDNYKNIDFRRVYQLKDKYPKVYMKVAERVESDWGETEKLLNQAMDQGLRVEFYSKNDKQLDLTHREFELLYYLAQHLGEVITRENLLETVWGYDYFGDVRTVDVTVRRLREKVEDTPSRPQYVSTRRGVGYYMSNPHD